MRYFVSVNKEIVKSNLTFGRNDPPYEIRTSKIDDKPVRVHEADFTGKVSLRYDKENPLISGAICWVEIEI